MDSQQKLILKSVFCFFTSVAVFGPTVVQADCSNEQVLGCTERTGQVISNIPINPPEVAVRKQCAAMKDWVTCMKSHACDLSSKEFESNPFILVLNNCDQILSGEYSKGASGKKGSSIFLITLISFSAFLL